MPYLVMGYAQGTGAPSPIIQLTGYTGPTVSVGDETQIAWKFRAITGSDSVQYGWLDLYAIAPPGFFLDVPLFSPVPDPWVVPGNTITPSDYEIRCTVTAGTRQTDGAGDTTTITPGTWYSLGTDRLVGSYWPGSGPQHDVTFLVEIRDVATQTVQASGSYSISIQP